MALDLPVADRETTQQATHGERLATAWRARDIVDAAPQHRNCSV